MTAMVLARGLRGYGDLMRELKVDPAALLRRHRISEASLDDEDALLSLRAVVHLLEASATATKCPDFGLRLSQLQDISVLGPLSIVMQNAPTVRDAMDYASRYMFVHSAGMHVTVHEHSTSIRDAAEVRMELSLSRQPGERQPTQRQTIDVCLGDIHRMLQVLAGTGYRPRLVTLPHTPIAPLGAYRRFYDAPVRIDQAHASLHFDRSTLDTDLQSANHTLRQMAVDYLSQHFSTPEKSLSQRVHQALRRTLGTPQSDKATIAALLGMHPRTLQRRLAAEHSSFDAIREEVRRDTALRYLRETRMPLSQLAGVLGFSEQSAMTRSCRRWFGATPSAIRRRADVDAAAAHRRQRLADRG
jgi:AraC-like DNA-binding protein